MNEYNRTALKSQWLKGDKNIELWDVSVYAVFSSEMSMTLHPLYACVMS